MGLVFRKTADDILGYVDADWGACLDDRKSYTVYAFILGGAAITWESRKQRTVALSTVEAEYVALPEAAKETQYLKKFVAELGMRQPQKTLFCDNQGAQCLAKNPMQHSRTKHIDIRHHYVRQR